MIKSLTESGKLFEAQTIILKELETQFGGAARAAAETYTGQLEQMGNTIGDIKERAGETFLILANPLIEKAFPIFQRYSDMLSAIFDESSQHEFLTSQLEAVKNNGIEIEKGTRLFRFAKASQDALERSLENATQAYETQLNIAQKNVKVQRDAKRANMELTDYILARGLGGIDMLSKSVDELTDQYNNLTNSINNAKDTKPVEDFNDIATGANNATSAISLFSQELLSAIPQAKAGGGIESAFGLGGVSLAFGKLNGDIKEVAENARESLNQIEMFGVNAANALSSAFGNWASSGFKNFDDYAKSFGKMLVQMVADAIAAFAVFKLLGLIPGLGGVAAGFGMSRGFISPIGKTSAGSGFSDGGLGRNAGSSQLALAGAENFSPNINVGQPAIYVTLDGQAIRSYVRREDAYDRRSRA